MVKSVKQARPIVPSCPVVEWIVRKARRWGRRGRWRDERGIAGWACGERERKKKTMAARIVGVKASSLISRADVFFRVKKERLLSGLRGFSFFSRIKTTYIKYGYLLIPVFSLPSFSFFIITHDIIMLLRYSRSIYPTLPIALFPKSWTLIAFCPCKKFQWKNWKFPFQTTTQSNTTNSSYSTISTSPPILSRNVACCVRSANWIVGGRDERAVCMFAARSFRLFACPCLQRAGPISRGASKADPASRAGTNDISSRFDFTRVKLLVNFTGE